jgi:hypothetical protein
MPKVVKVVALVAFIWALGSPALACPFCESDTAEKVRAGIFNSDFVYHLGVSFAPFPVLIAILFLIYYWPARRPRPTAADRLRSVKREETISEHT